MSQDSEAASGDSDGAIPNLDPLSCIDLHNLVLEEVVDPIEEQISDEVEAEILHQLDGGSMNQQPRRRRRYIERSREQGHERLMSDYFCNNPVYTEEHFRQRFRMRRHLFERIVQTLSNWSPYFRQSKDAANRPSFSPLQKCTIAMRMLAYASSADYLDENLRVGCSTAIKCLVLFVRGVKENFGSRYLRKPNSEDIQRLLQINEARGFPGMLGSIDCMHWEWKNCPKAWHGQYIRGDIGCPTVMLEEPHETFGYGMPFLASLALTTTSMC